MNSPLIETALKQNDAFSFLSQLIAVKIKQHEESIVATTAEEDIKFRERAISRLQKELHEFRCQPPSVSEEVILNISLRYLPDRHPNQQKNIGQMPAN